MSVRWRKDRGRWMIDVKYRHPDGTIERVRELARTRRGAEKREREIINAMESGVWKQRREEAKGPKSDPTFKEFADEFIETYAKVNNKPSEVMSKIGILDRYLSPVFEKKRLNQIRLRDIEQFKASMLKRELSPKTVNNALAVLSKMFRWAEEMEVVEKRPRIRLLKCARPGYDFLDFTETESLKESGAVSHVL